MEWASGSEMDLVTWMEARIEGRSSKAFRIVTDDGRDAPFGEKQLRTYSAQEEEEEEEEHGFRKCESSPASRVVLQASCGQSHVFVLLIAS